MNEFLILFILKTKSANIYEIKKFIDVNFAPFLQVSTGAIIPALKRLEKEEIIISEKIITEGGLRKSIYSITEKGEDYFNTLLEDEIEGAPQIIRREIEVLLMLINHAVFSDEQKILLKEKIINGIKYLLKIINKSIKNKIMNIEFLEQEYEYYSSILNNLTMEEDTETIEEQTTFPK